MRIFLNAIGKVIDFIALPFYNVGIFWSFFVLCTLIGALAVVLFKFLSNQKKIKKVKTQIKVHFLEIRLYKDDFREILKAQKEILKNNFMYIAYSFQAAIPIVIVVLLTISQLNLRYGYTSINPEEVFDVKVTYAKETDRRPEPQLIVPEGLEKITPALYLGEENEVSWQFRGVKKGRYQVGFKVCDQEYTKEIVIGTISSPFCPQLMRTGFLATFVNSIEAALPKDSLLDTIEIGYKPKYFKCIFFGWKLHWLLVFPIIAIGFGLVFRKVLKVD